MYAGRDLLPSSTTTFASVSYSTIPEVHLGLPPDYREVSNDVHGAFSMSNGQVSARTAHQSTLGFSNNANKQLFNGGPVQPTVCVY